MNYYITDLFATQISIGSSTKNVTIYSDYKRVYMYVFSLHKEITVWLTNIKIFTLHWINSIIRNKKCSFTKLNAVFIFKTAAWTKKIIQRFIPSQIPDRFSKLLCSTAVPSHINKTLSLENFRRHGATPRFYLHVVYI